MRLSTFLKHLCFLSGMLLPLAAQTPVGNPTDSGFRDQDYQPPEKCLPCHQRQYDELLSSVKSGYRNVSPLFNALELAGNFLNGGLLRPLYANSPQAVKTNLFTSPGFTQVRQVQAGFCFTCHNPHVEAMGDDPNKREVPEVVDQGAAFHPELIRPLRDYHLVDAQGKQILPEEFGGPPPPGARPSLGAAGVTCDVCHNVKGASLSRSFQGDGFANTALDLNHSIEKVGPFPFPVAVKDNFHVASDNPDKIAFLRSSALCNSCHDVRVPLGPAGTGPGDLQAYEFDTNPGGQSVTYYRLENLSTEWQIGAYNSTNNPFGKVVRCQDCHMSTFPYSPDSTYQVGDLKITSPTPGVFAENFAAVPGVSTDQNYPLPKRKVVSHYFTGIDVPLLSADELKERLGPARQGAFEPGLDEYGVPKALAARREALLKAATRISLDKTDRRAKMGEDFVVRAEAVSLTGHRFPAGFSQERTTYIQLTVKDDNGFLIYQSGYLVDKPHPETGELEPDGSLDDEDPEHIHAVADPGIHAATYNTGAGPAANGHTNQVFEFGPDNGPDARVYEGAEEGLVLFRNELTRVFLPGAGIGRNGVIADRPHYEETFSAGFANTVDNFRSLQPLVPRTFRYRIKLPTQEELHAMGIDSIKAPLHVHAQINFEHFPALFLRFLARTTGPNGPSGHDLHILDEKRLDTFLRNNMNISSADFTIDAVEQ